jgi:hypothetical protein
MEDILGIIFLLITVLWWFSFIYNSIYFFKSNDSEVDTVFLNKTKTFDEARNSLKTLEKHLEKKFSSSHEKINFYESNAKMTRRKFTYYSEKIEPFFLKMLIGGKGKLFSNCWELLEQPIKFHFIILYAFLGIIALLVFGVIIASFNFHSIILLILAVIFFFRLSNFIIKLNFVIFYLLIDGLLIISKQDRGRLYKNIALLSVINSKWIGGLNRNNDYALAAGGIVAYNSYGAGSDFGGFGGGSFGGGGAGGDW